MWNTIKIIKFLKIFLITLKKLLIKMLNLISSFTKNFLDLLISFFLIISGYFYLEIALVIFAITFPLFYIFEKEANEFMQNENYLKLRRNLSSAVSGCFMLSFLTTL